jgi:hypothetical protein
MPANIKTGLSILVLIIGAAVWYVERQAGNEALSWVVAGLAVFMVLAMWIFPETGAKKDDKG